MAWQEVAAKAFYCSVPMLLCALQLNANAAELVDKQKVSQNPINSFTQKKLYELDVQDGANKRTMDVLSQCIDRVGMNDAQLRLRSAELDTRQANLTTAEYVLELQKQKLLNCVRNNTDIGAMTACIGQLKVGVKE